MALGAAGNCVTLESRSPDESNHHPTCMKYWAYLVAKLAAAGALLWGLRRLLLGLAPVPETFMYVRPKDPFAQDLAFTFLMLLYWLFSVVLAWLIIWDQR